MKVQPFKITSACKLGLHNYCAGFPGNKKPCECSCHTRKKRNKKK